MKLIKKPDLGASAAGVLIKIVEKFDLQIFLNKNPFLSSTFYVCVKAQFLQFKMEQ